MVQDVSFKNFRRFEDFPTMTLGGINIFVGRNNSGKSTVLKALQLMKGNLNSLSKLSRRTNVAEALQPVFLFDVDELAELHIDNFERALYNKAKSKEITLSATMDHCSITIVLDGQSVKDSGYYVAVPYNYVELKLEDFKLSFNFKTRELFLDYHKRSEPFMNKAIDELHHDLEELNRQIELMQRELQNNFSDRDIHNSSPEMSELVERLNKRGELRHKIRLAIKKRQEVESRIADSINVQSRHEDISIHIKFLPFSDTTQDNIIDALFYNLELYASDESNSDRRRKENKEIIENKKKLQSLSRYLSKVRKLFISALDNFNLEYIHAHAASPKAIYLKEDKNDVLSKTLSEFCKARIPMGSSECGFVTTWMKRFDIGENFEIKEIESSGYTLKIIENGEKLNLADKGTGSIQIMTMLLTLALLLNKVNSSFSSLTLLIEEPEQNIHPKLQAELADMFVDFVKKVGEQKCQLIIETHSEYLVRRVQGIVGENKYINVEDLNENNIFNVFYFNKEDKDVPWYKMIFEVTGGFENRFGEGFFDAASELDMALIRREKALRKETVKELLPFLDDKDL